MDFGQVHATFTVHLDSTHYTKILHGAWTWINGNFRIKLPYIGLMYEGYLQLRILKFPLNGPLEYLKMDILMTSVEIPIDILHDLV